MPPTASCERARRTDKRHCALPQGRSFTHGRFLHKLRRAAVAQKTTAVAQGTVTTLVREDEDGPVTGVTVKDGDGNVVTIKAQLTVVADGCFSKFRKQLVAAAPEKPGHFIGYVIHGCDLPLPEHGNVLLANPNPVLLYQIATDEHRILVDMPGALPSKDGIEKYMLEVVAPQFPKQCLDAFLREVKAGNYKTMPNQNMTPRDDEWTRGALLLGDSYNMRHPLTGGGMTVGFGDVVLVREALRNVPDLGDYAAVEREIKAFRAKRKPLSATINILAPALHAVFTGDGPVRASLREACFEYLSKGGWFAAGPIGFLSGLDPNPGFLFTHFFFVAFYTMKKLLLPIPTPSGIWHATKVLKLSTDILFPLIAGERATILAPFLSTVYSCNH